MTCALAGAAEFNDACTVIRSRRGDDVILTVIAPDGGFRRLAVAPDGAEIRSADGAEQVRMGMGTAGVVEISVGRDRYRLPAGEP